MNIDMDMDTTGEVTDYGSFEYQHFQFRQANPDQTGRNTAVASFDPLEASSGLDANEVAELVGIRAYSGVSADNFDQSSNQEPGGIEFRGVFGVDLDSDADQLEPNDPARNSLGSAQLIEGSGGVRVNGHDRDEVLHHWDVNTEVSFNDTVNGTGGGGSSIHYNVEERNLRAMLGRGPILDSNDSLSVVASVIKNQVNFQSEALFRASLVWDVATTDEAGRRFSVPEGM